MNHILLLCDNESAIKITYNPCEYSRTKYIDIRHHFLRDHTIKWDIVISHVGTNDQLAVIFTKPIDEKRFRELWNELNIIDSQNVAYFVAHLIWNLLCLKNMPLCQTSYLCKNLSMLYDSNGFKLYIYMFCFLKLVYMPHIYIFYWSTPKSIEYQIFGQFLKLPSRFSPDMSDLRTGHIRLAGHVWLLAQTCPGLGFQPIYTGVEYPFEP
jgi:hypothetical protein